MEQMGDEMDARWRMNKGERTCMRSIRDKQGEGMGMKWGTNGRLDGHEGKARSKIEAGR